MFSDTQGQGSGRRWPGFVLTAPATAIVLLVIFIPMLQLVRYSLNRFDPSELMQSALILDNYRKFVTDPYYVSVMWTTFKVAATCTVLALILGFPVAYYLARTESRFKSLLIILIVFPLLVGNVVRAAGWMTVLGSTGVVNSLLMKAGLVSEPVRLLYTPLAVILGTTGIVLPFMILTLQSVLEGIDRSVEEASRNLGAAPMVTFARVLLPLAAPGVAAGTMLVFILCMNAYATPVLLGGTGIKMMAPMVYEQFAQVNNWPFGSALALILMAATFCVAGLSSALLQRNYTRTMTS